MQKWTVLSWSLERKISDVRETPAGRMYIGGRPVLLLA